MRLRRTRLSYLDPRIGRLEGDLVAAVAERAVGGSAAATEGERGLPRQVVFVALGVHHFDNAVGIVYAQRTVVAHRNRDLRHETSRKMNCFQTIAQRKKSPVARNQWKRKNARRTRSLRRKPATGLSPSIHSFKPYNFQPLIKSGFRPFAVRPPGSAELRGIAGRRRAELILRQAMAEDHQGTAGVKFRGHNQHPMRTHRLHASAYVVDLGKSRKNE